MEAKQWEERYRSESRSVDVDSQVTPLVVKTAAALRPGRALDLASGTGRNSLWLAAHGWTVTAVDASATAIDILLEHAGASSLRVFGVVADLTKPGGTIWAEQYDLVLLCYYLQRSLFEPAKRAVRLGGSILAIVHTTQGDEEPTEHRLRPGELQYFFKGWTIEHYREGRPIDPAHKRAVSELVARRPIEG